MLYKKSEIKNGVFIKVVTKSNYEDFDKIPSHLKKIWTERYAPKFKNEYPNVTSRELAIDSYYDHAKYQAEFSTITSAAIGVIEELTKGKLTSTVIPINAQTEKGILTDLVAAMDKFPGYTLAGYNITNYQAPLIIKRLLVNKVTIPFHLALRGKKPWEISVIDVMKDYQGNMFGDVDIRLVADQFNIKCKDDMTAAEELQTTLDIALAMSI